MTDSAPILFLFGLAAQAGGMLSEAPFSDVVTTADQYALSADLLAGRRALVLTMHQDQRWLERHGAVLQDFLEAGGTILAQGQVAVPWLPMLRAYVPVRRPPLETLEIKRVEWHPLFDGVEPGVLNIRTGVRGFYGRGHNPPPAGAKVIQTLGNGDPVDWEIRVGRGLLFMHSGNDLWTNCNDASDNRRLVGNLIDWCLTPATKEAANG